MVSSFKREVLVAKSPYKQFGIKTVTWELYVYNVLALTLCADCVKTWFEIQKRDKHTPPRKLGNMGMTRQHA